MRWDEHWVDYVEVRRDGDVVQHTCYRRTAEKMAVDPDVVFAALIGRPDGVPGIVERLAGSEDDYVSERMVIEVAQYSFPIDD